MFGVESVCFYVVQNGLIESEETGVQVLGSGGGEERQLLVQVHPQLLYLTHPVQHCQQWLDETTKHHNINNLPIPPPPLVNILLFQQSSSTISLKV